MKTLIHFSIILFACVLLGSSSAAAAHEAEQRVQAAIDYWRGTASYIEARMTIHRPEWERSMSLRSWGKGRKNTLVRFTSPPKDAGNASLTLDEEVWTFSPKVNNVIKIPPSMKAQSWMGSDFSYSDLSKADDMLVYYDHKIVGHEINEGKNVDVIESIPHESAPVVWGKEIVKVREDNIITEHSFYDQNMKLVKTMSAKEIATVGGRLYAKVVRMENAEKKDEWTEVVHDKADFGISIPDSVFTLSNLRNPRD